MKRWLWIILLMALVGRLVYGVAQDPLAPYVRGGGDSWWFLLNGSALVTGSVPEGELVDVSRLPTPPGFLVMLGAAQAVFPPAEAVIAVRFVQAIMGVVICWCAYRLALRLTGRESAGLLAAFVMAISPAFIIESAQIVSETLYMFLLSLGFVAYVESLKLQASSDKQQGSSSKAQAASDTPETTPSRLRVFASLRQSSSDWRLELAACSCFFGLAALTRAPILLFPVGLAIHLLIVYGLRAGWRKAVLLLVVYAAVVSTWTIYNQLRWGRFVIAGEGFASFIYIGATGWDGPQAVDERLGSTGGGATGDEFIDAATASISADPLGYVRRRVSELAGSVLQPHGTAYFPGESLRDLVIRWFRADGGVDGVVAIARGDFRLMSVYERDGRTLAGLVAITRGDAFGQKALLYLFHYAALIGGLVGIWRTRRNWRVSLVLIGFIVYTLLVHLALLALPRYIFPTFIAWVIFAASTVFPPLSDAAPDTP